MKTTLLFLSVFLSVNLFGQSPYLKSAIKHYQIGEFQEAIDDFSREIKINPNLFYAYYHRALAYKKFGKFEEAISDYSRCIELKPLDWISFSNRAVAYFYSGKFPEAMSDFNKCLEINPFDKVTIYSRGLLYYTLGQHQNAIDDYGQALTIKDTVVDFERMPPTEDRLSFDMMVYLNRAIAFGSLGGHYDQAIEDFNRVIENAPCYFAFFNRAKFYTQQKQYQLAIKDLNQTIKNYASKGEVFNLRGLCKYMDGKDGCEDLRKAQSLGYNVTSDVKQSVCN